MLTGNSGVTAYCIVNTTVEEQWSTEQILNVTYRKTNVKAFFKNKKPTISEMEPFLFITK